MLSVLLFYVIMFISLNDIYEILYRGQSLSIDSATLSRIDDCYHFLQSFSSEKIIYGINTGFGPMAQWRIDDARRRDLQYNIIRSHCTGAGKPLSDIDAKSAMIARLGTLLQARSGVHRDAVLLLEAFINNDIIPVIPEHGSVGASGDLVQLSHIALCLIGEGMVHYHGETLPARDVMSGLGITPLEIHIREGLSLTNGTSVMTGIAAVNHFDAEELLRLSIVASVWMNEVAASYDDMMAAEENNCRRHSGQQYVAAEMRRIASGSQRFKHREHELYNGSIQDKVFKHKVQAYYSLRCTPQILGPVKDTLDYAARVIEDEFNSASDNPIIDYEAGNVFHGGNFHGDYISLEQDKVKAVVTRMAMTAERQFNYLVNDRINGILPPFLNRGELGLNYGMQACQFTATSTTAECQTLSMPNYVHSIPNNNDNQDIVSMGTNSALLASRVIDNTYQVISILLMGLAEATDILNIYDALAPSTRSVYDLVRANFPVHDCDRPFHEDIARLISALRHHPLRP